MTTEFITEFMDLLVQKHGYDKEVMQSTWQSVTAVPRKRILPPSLRPSKAVAVVAEKPKKESRLGAKRCGFIFEAGNQCSENSVIVVYGYDREDAIGSCETHVAKISSDVVAKLFPNVNAKREEANKAKREKTETKKRCQAKTVKGDDCSYPARPDINYCKIHRYYGPGWTGYTKSTG